LAFGLAHAHEYVTDASAAPGPEFSKHAQMPSGYAHTMGCTVHAPVANAREEGQFGPTPATVGHVLESDEGGVSCQKPCV
jgi:hypothetical protein